MLVYYAITTPNNASFLIQEKDNKIYLQLYHVFMTKETLRNVPIFIFDAKLWEFSF